MSTNRKFRLSFHEPIYVHCGRDYLLISLAVEIHTHFWGPMYRELQSKLTMTLSVKKDLITRCDRKNVPDFPLYYNLVYCCPAYKWEKDFGTT